jgi:ATP synthase protein I
MGPNNFREDSGWIKRIVSLSALGLTLVIATMIGFAIGYYLDSKLGTKPWLTLAFFLIGVAAGFYTVFKEVFKEIRRDEKESKGGNH